MKHLITFLTASLSVNKNSMLRFLKIISAMVLAVCLIPAARAFVLRGPINNEPIGYQVDTIAYGLGGDLSAAKNIGEEYRRTKPVMYYSFNQSFLEFFGSNGVAAVDQAFSILNTVTNLSSFSPDLSEFPLEAQRVNYTAEALSLYDLRSVTLGAMIEQLGTGESVRYVWGIKNRFLFPGQSCPAGDENYTIIQRNFDIIPSPANQLQYSSYVNGVLYSYVIEEFCTGPPPLADAVEFAVDPEASQFSAVGDYFSQWYVGLPVGAFYTYLTRDDVGGLRYVMGTNNYNIENSGADTVQFVTNNTPEFLITQDLGLLIAQSKTNSAAQLQALYPGLIVTEVSSTFKVVRTTNITQVVGTSPFAPAGSVGLISVTNVVPSIVQFFTHTFDNIITNNFSSQTTFSIQTVSPGNSAFWPAGSAPTLFTSTKTFKRKAPSGDFYILPPGLCAIKILNSNLLATVIATTNLISTTTNTTAGGDSNQTFTVSTVSYFTNHAIVYLPIECPGDTVGLRQGINGIQFVRRDFDSLIGTFFAPVITNYSVASLTNNIYVRQTFQRTINQPDFLFDAVDLAEGPSSTVNLAPVFDRNLTFNQANVLPGLAGPGTIENPTFIRFDRSTPIYLNLGLGGPFLTELTHSTLLAFGTFDATTNEPIVYPNGLSIVNLENMLVLRVLPQAGALPDGNKNVAYSFTGFSIGGGQAPYVWSLAPGSAGLPPGFNAVDPNTGALTAATPTTRGTFDFTIRLTDAGARFVDVPYSITINP